MTKRTDDDNGTQNQLKNRVKKLGLFGLLAAWDRHSDQPWVPALVTLEETERQKRSLERRIHGAKIGSFKPLADFDWTWPKAIDREALEELFRLAFIGDGTNAVLLGPNGVGKTMLLRNLSHHAVMHGHSVCFTTASDMLADLAAQESAHALARRVRKYTKPRLLCVDEVGYLSYNNRYADLLFEVVSRRYDAPSSIVLSTNKPFGEWSAVFPHAACVVTLVDRLLHRAEVITIDGDSYRLKEAKERSRSRKPKRRDAAHDHPPA
jgi:DNA replication protein DnaC